ncbi:golgin-45 [Engraulis encrasicolus]|uniref:golgin-45 n=1 Tax=Engraulis encrasicolus TaxID=184585 RepID=UPI002FD5BD2D
MSTEVIMKVSSRAVPVSSRAVPVRGSGDGMEMDKPSVAPEITMETPLLKVVAVPMPKPQTPHRPSRTGTPNPTPTPTPTRSPALTPPPPPLPPLAPAVLHLGKVCREACTEVEAVRIVVPKAAISRCSARTRQQQEEGRGDNAGVRSEKGSPLHSDHESSSSDLLEWKSAMEKLQNSERRLLQDREGLSNQLRVQTEVNRELKKLLVASVGDDLQYHFERLSREKNQLLLENEVLGRNLTHTAEQLERMSIQCDVWRSKFLASRVMAEELNSSRAALQRQTREAQGAIQDLLNEREEFSQEMLNTHRSLEHLLVSLQWGSQQKYYPSAQPLSTGELAQANRKLSCAINRHLLGDVGNAPSSSSSSNNCNAAKSQQGAELCNTPAEKMAEKVLRSLDPISGAAVVGGESGDAEGSPDSPPSSFLSAKKSIGRFHPYTRYENITFNCCERCNGDLLVL